MRRPRPKRPTPTPLAGPPPSQALGQYVHGAKVTAWPAHGGKVPAHGAPISQTDPPSGAPQP